MTDRDFPAGSELVKGDQLAVVKRLCSCRQVGDASAIVGSQTIVPLNGTHTKRPALLQQDSEKGDTKVLT
jgi:hypothetical protein